MKKHSTDTVSFVFALIFGSMVAWWGVDRAADLTLDGRWVLVIGLVVVALITLISTVASRKKAPAAAVPAAVPVGVGAAGPLHTDAGPTVDDAWTDRDADTAVLEPTDEPEAVIEPAPEQDGPALDVPERDEPTLDEPAQDGPTAVVRRPDDPEPRP
jgi:hypothetical protein